MSRRPVFCAALLATFFTAAACKEEGAVKVSSLKFNGTKAVTEKQIKSVLATAASAKLPWGTKRFFHREQFEADLKRITAFYKDRGFPDARVTSFDVKLSADQTSVAIVVNIAEGEPVRVERIVFEGFEKLPPEHLNDLQGKLPLKVGQPMDRAVLQASRESALDELKDHGYPYATVRLAESAGASERQRVVTLGAEPGPIAYHGPIDVSGNSSVEDTVVRRQLTFKPGDLYRQSKLRESQRRLYQLEVFDFVNVEPLRTDEKPAEIPTRVTVTEGKHRKVNFGVGYGTEEKARAEIDWRHVNFFGGARTAGVEARYSSLDRGVRLRLREPYFFSPRYSIALTGQSWHTNEPMFELLTSGGRVTITREFGLAGGPVLARQPATSFGLTYANEYDDYTVAAEALADPTLRDDLIAMGVDPRFGTGGGQRSAISLDGGRNTTGNILDARRGYVATVHLEQAGKWLGGSFDYLELSGEGRYYITVAERAVIAVRARGGSIDGLGRPEDALPDPGTGRARGAVPFFKRYFLGGATNLRGWGRFDVAPLSAAGLPLGGHSFMNFSTEVRVPIWGNLGGVVFLDGGNVWTNPWEFKLNDLRYDVGPGLRYNTPIGPIRFDLGYQLNPIPGLLVNGEPETRRFRVHFSIGQAF
jgi:outer membrane protein assembly complex protein YaeT